MKLRLTLLIVSAILSVRAQEFSSLIKFSTLSPFHRDTVIIGYDNSATDTLDGAFNEINIKGVPYHSPLDVRASNVWMKQHVSSYSDQTPFQTKKQIVPKHCGNNSFATMQLDIVSDSWPVMVDWDRSVFQDSCRNGTTLTNMNPAHWWRGQGFIEEFAKWNYHPIYPNQWYYMDGNDTVNVFWLAVGDSQSVRLFIPEVPPNIERFRIRPNPASNYFFVDVPDDFGELKSLDIFSIEGKLLYQNYSVRTDIGFLPKGVYLVTLYNHKQQPLRTKLIKAN